MLHLNNIKLTQFKNYKFFDIAFNKNIIGICGANGMGKTNLLDAIYYCCFTKSYFGGTDQLNTKFGYDGFRLDANFTLNNKTENVICVYRDYSKKELSLNGIAYEKFSKHIGLLPVVMIAPDDINLITGGSEGRRKFLDTMMSQLNDVYLKNLINYNKILIQRNSLLKTWNEKPDDELLNILSSQMEGPAEYIFNARKEFLKELLPKVNSLYYKIAPDEQHFEVQYQSQMNNISFSNLMLENKKKDIITQRTNGGIHKDDMVFLLQSNSFKNIASQGQKKSLLFALKLAEYELILKHKQACILLLDDIFEKLDSVRMNNLMTHVCKNKTGQVFITDTHRQRIEETFSGLDVDAQIIELTNADIDN